MGLKIGANISPECGQKLGWGGGSILDATQIGRLGGIIVANILPVSLAGMQTSLIAAAERIVHSILS